VKRQSPPFVRRHRISLKEAILTPMIWCEQVLRDVPEGASLPAPPLALLRDFAEYSGYSYGAFRTAISRGRADGDLDAYEDEQGVTRFRLTELERAVGGVVQARGERPDGYLIAVFSFKAEQEAARRKVRELLSWFGFVRFAQNAYANGLIDSSALEKALDEAGVSDSTFLFRCPSSSSLDARFARLFGLGERARKLKSLRRDLEAFLLERGLGAEQRGRRFVYAGPVQHKACFMEEPPVPASCLPEGYPLDDLESWFGNAAKRAAPSIFTYLRSFEKDR
jgi:DNA-binding transcriptional regulator PaaX